MLNYFNIFDNFNIYNCIVCIIYRVLVKWILEEGDDLDVETMLLILLFS